MKTQLKKGNTVKILAGDEKGKTGEIIEIIKLISRRGILNKRAIVKGLNLVKKHQKATKESKGGVVSIEKSIHLSNLSLVQSDKKSVEGKKEVSKKEIKSKKPKLEGEKKRVKKNSAKKDIKKVTKPIKKTKKS
jgi:large subunit ribosomal protein L24